MAQQFPDAELFGRIVFHHQQAFAARRGIFLDSRQAASSPSGVVGLVTKEKAPRAKPCCRSSSSVSICTGMCRVAGSCFRWFSTVQPSMSGRNTSSETAVGWNSRASASASEPRDGHQNLESLVAREIAQARARSADRLRRSAASYRPGCRLSRSSGICSIGCSTIRQRSTAGAAGRRSPSCPSQTTDGRADISLGQVKRERASLARRAAQLNFPSEKTGQFTADRQSQPRAAIFAAGAGIGLLECLKDDALFLRRNADAGVGHLERDHRCRAAENRVTLAPSVA